MDATLDDQRPSHNSTELPRYYASDLSNPGNYNETMR